jgi:regulator of protease activity HflC (stomatin/prohibitin superfamily)
MVSVPIEYRIKDILQYLYNYQDPVKLMEEIAYQYLSDFAASVDIDELIGPSRERFNAHLHDHIQQRLDDLECGIEIVFAGIRGAHPPAQDQVAATFQSVVSAQTNMAATINAAEGEAQKILTGVAGTEARAQALDEAIRERDAVQSAGRGEPEVLAEAHGEVRRLLLGDPSANLSPLSGEAASVIAQARAKASDQVRDAASKARAFGTEIVAWKAARELYEQRKWLEVFEDLDFVRKYLIVGDPANVIIEYQTAEEGGLDQVLSEGLNED